MPDNDVLFGASLGQWNGADAADAAGRLRLGVEADRDGLARLATEIVPAVREAVSTRS